MVNKICNTDEKYLAQILEVAGDLLRAPAKFENPGSVMMQSTKTIVIFNICQGTQEICALSLVQNNKHWKQALTVKTLVDCIEWNKNLQDGVVLKSNLGLSKSRKCCHQCYQCFNLKPLKGVAYTVATILSFKIYILFMSAITHHWSFFAIFIKQTFCTPFSLSSHLNLSLSCEFQIILSQLQTSQASSKLSQFDWQFEMKAIGSCQKDVKN